jgi:ERCC4-related helicase
MKYINDDITEEGCLISLPTGTGKTGVMTYVVNYLAIV